MIENKVINTIGLLNFKILSDKNIYALIMAFNMGKLYVLYASILFYGTIKIDLF